MTCMVWNMVSGVNPQHSLLLRPNVGGQKAASCDITCPGSGYPAPGTHSQAGLGRTEPPIENTAGMEGHTFVHKKKNRQNTQEHKNHT
jgi:hypothetical protein